MDITCDTTNGFYCDEVEWDEQIFDSIEFEQIFDKIILPASTNSSNKRKTTDIDDLLSLPTIEFDSFVSISHNNCDLEQPEQCIKLDDEKFDEENAKSITIEQYLPTGIWDDEFDDFPMSESPPITIEQYLATRISGNEFDDFHMSESHPIPDVSMMIDQAVGMRFEVNPAPRFRGRTLSELKRKDEHMYNGKPAKTGVPRYFGDGNTRSYLNLLIPKAYLSPGLLDNCLEICIVTPEINGYTYIHPYFKFQTHPTDTKSPNLNPIYQFFDDTTQLKSVSDEMFQLQLKLVVVMHTYNELMQTEQPLKIFSTSTNNHNRPLPTIRYKKARDFIKAYRLREMRFAITLWKKEPGEKVFYRHDDKQFISSISTEDRTYTKKNQNQF